MRSLNVLAPMQLTRPRTRGECADVPRPCPFASCRFSLLIDLSRDRKHVIVRFPDEDGDPDLTERDSCALDVADRGEHDTMQLGTLLNLSHQAVEQAIYYVAARKQSAFAKCRDASPQENLKEPIAASDPRATRMRPCKMCKTAFHPAGNHRTCESCVSQRPMVRKCSGAKCRSLASVRAGYCRACKPKAHARVRELAASGSSVPLISRMLRMRKGAVLDALKGDA